MHVVPKRNLGGYNYFVFLFLIFVSVPKAFIEILGYKMES